MILIMLLSVAFADCKMHHPKRLFGIPRKPISIIQLIAEPLMGQERTSEFAIERLEFDQNLLLQQELIEEDVSEFPKTNYTMPEFSKRKEGRKRGYKEEFQKVKQLVIDLHYQEVLLCLFGVSVFSSLIWCIMRLCYKPQEEQAVPDYSILNSKTISEDDQSIKYRITDMTPQIRNPYEESFVKDTLKATTKGSACDQSLLEIDELLQEMLK